MGKMRVDQLLPSPLQRHTPPPGEAPLLGVGGRGGKGRGAQSQPNLGSLRTSKPRSRKFSLSYPALFRPGCVCPSHTWLCSFSFFSLRKVYLYYRRTCTSLIQIKVLSAFLLGYDSGLLLQNQPN